MSVLLSGATPRADTRIRSGRPGTAMTGRADAVLGIRAR
jgi:hypothetical protein